MCTTKKEIRQSIKRLKQQCPDEQRQELSEAALNHLMELPAWRTSRVVLLYAALPDEVPTRELLHAALADGKLVLLPVVEGDDLELRPYKGDDELRPGAFDIEEPQGEAYTCFENIDLAIVPGIAFTHKGQRLGRGRGYYDRLLPRLEAALKVGLCWPFQLVKELPCEPHDVLMDLVIC